MSPTDAHGNAVSGANAVALDHFDAALAAFRCYRGDPLALLDRAMEAAPGFAMAHVMRAHVLLTGTEASGIAPARTNLAAAAKLAQTPRERLHVAAATALADGRYGDAVERFEDVLLSHPRDGLALQMAHLFDFFRGDSRALRDRIVRVLPNWSADVPGYHAVLGMLSFGLEEMGEYGAAEQAGREAVSLEPTDAWAHHAVAHVLEMQGRADEGVAWMIARTDHWAPDNAFAVHNWWHLALFRMAREEIGKVLALYDQRIRAGRSTVVLDMIDASALLWRLKLLGHDAGAERWREIAAAWAPSVEDGIYAFNDVHALMAFLGAGADDLVTRQIATLRRAAAGGGSNAGMSAEVGLPVAEALRAFAYGRYDDAVAGLRQVRGIAHRFGGSHAQRDLIDWTLIEAASRSGDVALMRALAAERLRAKPGNPVARRYAALSGLARAA